MAESVADGHLSIGEVLGVLLQEFPDVTISKIRFLESQGLINPERTPSGYRKFYSDDVDLLRVILTEQRENYLPLRVIKDRLDSGEIDPTGEHLRPLQAVESDPADTPADTPSDTPAETSSDSSADQVSAPLNSPPDTADQPPALKVPRVAVEKEPSSVGTRPSTLSEAPTELLPVIPPAPTLTSVPMDHSSAGTDQPAREQQLARPTDIRSASKPEPPNSANSKPDASDGVDDTGTEPSQEVPVTSVASHPAARSAARRDERRAASPRLLPGVMLDAGELCGMVGITRAELEELEAFGIIVGRDVIGGRVYTEDAVEIAKPAGALLKAGVDSRHLRAWRTAAEREASLYEQLIAPRLRQRNPEARAEAMAQLRELESTGDALHDALVRSALRPHFEA